MKRWLMVPALALGIGLAASAPSHAQASLETAKRSGVIGERPELRFHIAAADVRVEHVLPEEERRGDVVQQHMLVIGAAPLRSGLHGRGYPVGGKAAPKDRIEGAADV